MLCSLSRASKDLWPSVSVTALSPNLLLTLLALHGSLKNIMFFTVLGPITFLQHSLQYMCCLSEHQHSLQEKHGAQSQLAWDVVSHMGSCATGPSCSLCTTPCSAVSQLMCCPLLASQHHEGTIHWHDEVGDLRTLQMHWPSNSCFHLLHLFKQTLFLEVVSEQSVLEASWSFAIVFESVFLMITIRAQAQQTRRLCQCILHLLVSVAAIITIAVSSFEIQSSLFCKTGKILWLPGTLTSLSLKSSDV